MQDFQVIDRGNGWAEYLTIFASPDYFEALDEYRALVRQNPDTFYLLVCETGTRVSTIRSSETDRFSI